MLNVDYGDKIISVESEYNPMFVRKARALHGTWNKPAWEFNASMKDAVRKALIDCYGDDGMSKSVKVRINLSTCEQVEEKAESIYLAGKCLIATRFYRDSEVKLPDDVYCVDGCFRNRGGSVKHPCVTWENGTVVEMDIPQAVYYECKDDGGVTLVDDNATNVQRWRRRRRNSCSVLKKSTKN